MSSGRPSPICAFISSTRAWVTPSKETTRANGISISSFSSEPYGHALTCGCGAPPPRRLLHGEHVDRGDVRRRGQQVIAHLRQRFRDLTVDMGLPSLRRLEGVEDPVVGLVDLEGVPGHGPLLRQRQLAPRFEELAERLAFARLRLELNQQSKLHGHLCSSISLVWYRGHRSRRSRSSLKGIERGEDLVRLGARGVVG